MKLGKLLTTGKLADLQTLTPITLGFAGCLRWDDLSHICVGDLSFHRDYVAVFLQSRKNDQFREGSCVFVSRWKGVLYPVALTEQLLDEGHQTQLASLFGRIRSLGGKQVIRATMSYSIAGESIRTALASVGADPDKYGQHSLRSEVVSVAAAAGLQGRLIQHHGGWKSKAGMKCYFTESMLNLVIVSLTIFIFFFFFLSREHILNSYCMKEEKDMTDYR